jgi:hypothetical protein
LVEQQSFDFNGRPLGVCFLERDPDAVKQDDRLTEA